MRKHTAGFTLIELMLAIAIMAMIASIGVIYLRHQIESAGIQKAAKEIESTLQAAQTFYRYTGKWPDNNFTQAGSDCVAQDPTNNIFIAKYLPNENYQDTFGGHYCWAQSQDPNVQFWVAVKIPLISNATNTINLAKQIAAEIPNGAITSNPAALTPDNCANTESCYVKAAVSSGSASGTKDSVAGIGTCPPNANNVPGSAKNMVCSCTKNPGNHPTYCTVTFNACPSNTKAILSAKVNFLTMPELAGDGQFILGQEQVNMNPCTLNSNMQENCKMTLTGKTLSNFYVTENRGDVIKIGSIGANYIAFCRPITQTQKQHFL